MKEEYSLRKLLGSMCGKVRWRRLRILVAFLEEWRHMSDGDMSGVVQTPKSLFSLTDGVDVGPEDVGSV